VDADCEINWLHNLSARAGKYPINWKPPNGEVGYKIDGEMLKGHHLDQRASYRLIHTNADTLFCITGTDNPS
jgi:hypothetical protein